MWLCARFPLLYLDQELSPETRSLSPQALLAQHSILEVNRAAFAAGVRTGQTLSTARTLCPALQVRTPSPERMQQRLEQLALWAYRFTPELSVTAPDSLLLEVSASLKLFGGFEPLFNRLRWGFRKRRIPVSYGLAHSPLGAQLLSQDKTALDTLLHGDGALNRQAVIHRLNQQPSHRLACETRQKEQLLTMGLTTLGQVNDLPRGALNRRFGKAFSLLLDRIYGEQPDPRPRFQPPDSFFGERQFNGELTRREELRFPVAGLLDDLGHFLQLKQWMSRHLNWQFHYSNGQHECLSLPVSHTHFDRRQLLSLVLLKLEGFKLQGPVDALALHCTQFEAVEQRNSELFQHSSLFDHERHNRYLALLDKLQTRLGTEALWSALPQAEHLPERASQAVSPLTSRQNTLANDALRPLWLLDQSLALHDQNGRPYWQGPLQLLQGPERIDSLWWHDRQARDYYIARAANYALCWVYRDCLQGRWYLHGFFG